MLRRIVLLCIGVSLPVCENTKWYNVDDSKSPLATDLGDDVLLSERIKTIQEVLLQYDEDLDRLVPFKEIQEALQGLDIVTKNYTGNSRNNIINARSFGYQATDNYFRGRDKIVAWCASASRVFKYIVKHHADLPQDKIQRSIRLQLNKGLITLRDSISSLETVVHQLSAMEQSLRPVPDSLNEELKELRREHSQAVTKKENYFYKTIAFMRGELNLQFTKAYFLALTKTVQGAEATATKMMSLLNERIAFVDRNLNEIGTELETDDVKINISKFEMAKIIEELTDFLIEIDKITERHLSE